MGSFDKALFAVFFISFIVLLLPRHMHACECVCACVRACVRACVHACVRACVRAVYVTPARASRTCPTTEPPP